MRLRGFLTAVLAIIVMVVWSGCDEASQVEQLQGPGPSFAKSGPPPPECDLKRLPVTDYFTSRSQSREVTSLLRDLSAACVDGSTEDVNGFQRPVAYGIGFVILTKVEMARWLPPIDEWESVFSAGGDIVAGVSKAMAFRGPACSRCDDEPITAEAAKRSLWPGGGFGVRSNGSDAVFSMENGDGERWGIEPSGSWGAALPADEALIYGYPRDVFDVFLGFGNEKALPNTGFGFDWNVWQWYASPTNSDVPLLVGSCAESETQVPLISHKSSLLPTGSGPSYCFKDDGFPVFPEFSLGESVTHFASMLLPFWPQDLNASLMVGKSGSGKAREFSPFYGYDIPFYAGVQMSRPEKSVWDFDKASGWSEILTFIGFDDSANPPATGAFALDWTTPTWSDSHGEYGGNEVASYEILLISAVENNGAKVVLDFAEPSPNYGTCARGGDGNQIRCECDGTKNAITPCDRLELTGLRLNKTGVYSLCVTTLQGPESSGLAIEQCTGEFHVKPNP